MQWQVFCLPYNMFLYCLSWIAALLLRFLVVAGAPPSEYANKAKVCQGVEEHKHRWPVISGLSVSLGGIVCRSRSRDAEAVLFQPRQPVLHV